MKDIRFVKSVFKIVDIPGDNLPQVVLCGRSNVGKSSFINALFNRKGLAMTSSTPGKTRGINYYLVEDKYYLVDLPGFGYAKVSEKERAGWQRLIESFLKENKAIELALHFIDSRITPSPLDILLNDYLREIGVPYIVMLNKIDKLKQSEKAASKKIIKETFPELIEGDNLILHSSSKGTGKNEIRKRLISLFMK